MAETSPVPIPSEADLQLWREAMTHLRHLSDDVFKSVVFFTGLNALLLAGIAFLIVMRPDTEKTGWICAAACVLGIALSLAARFMLRRHRIYYLEMLAKKSFLEMHLGLYDRKFTDTSVDFALPWRLKPEVVREIAKDFDGWVQKSIRSKGTIVRVYFLIYEILVVLYTASALFSLWRLYR